ncbi:DUF3750 domain-containing protein [Nitratireductor pacificus]|uniref:DUF3750 domain-containing protein n=1 Tax=Nitratireductor pacificus pht-3B TaxID=391937 RepID=K2MR32_9HYPH|nr:DUF3750 domain-containing protein [Nitratireductor pacificus]EKF19822.1 hypothetical protein NA2_05758 [Nitratireductor pacificus pht-3B]
MRNFKRAIVFLIVVFILPSAASAGWWALQDRPGSWWDADWSASGVLPAAISDDEAAVYVLAARTGGMKGALSVHSWIVTKKAGASGYDRYDKVGWGLPVRRNAYAADARWYSNTPFIVAMVRGPEAERLIPRVEAAIASYPFSRRGDYGLWPGPNSNSFAAHVLRAVPELHAELPPTAIGRDYRPGIIAFEHSPNWSDIHLSLGGLAGFAAGLNTGIELHFLGLVAGIDLLRPALKIPGFGRLELWSPADASAGSV